MKRTLLLAAVCLAASLAQAAPPIPLDQLQLRVTYRPVDVPGIGGVGSSMYNCRFFGGSVYAVQINNYCWASFLRGSSIASASAKDRQTRMVSPIPGTSYLLTSGGTLVPFTRYDLDGTHPVDSASFPDGEKAESFDWVDNDTIICNDYGANKQRLYLVDVTTTPDTLVLTKNTNWNGNGWVTTPVSTRIRNVRVGQTDTNFAYYGDNGVADNPKVYAIDLRSGASTELSHWDGTLRTGATSSFGLWTVVERGGYLYLHTSDDGIQVYSMSGPTTMGAMVASYSPEQLRPITPIAGGGNSPFYGFDVAPDGEGMILGDFVGDVFELQRRVPVVSGGWQLRARFQPYVDLGKTAGSMYNPRFCDTYVYANEIGDAAHACFGRYDADTGALQAGVIPATEHRMVTSFRDPYNASFMLASGGAYSTTFTRYDFAGYNPVAVDFFASQAVESFDWVDNDTFICNDYKSGFRKRLYLVDVVAEPFALVTNTTWNADGFITSAITTRIRNVRVGEGAGYSNYAYYGDNQVSVNPKVYALNLTTGIETELGHWNGTLKAGVTGGAKTDSWGLWTVVERAGYLYLQSSDDGIQVYNMINPTNMGSLYTFFSPDELNGITHDPEKVLYGCDVAPKGERLLLGSYTGTVYELEPALQQRIALSGTNVIISWPTYHTGVIVESSATLEAAGFADVSPQPAVVVVGAMNVATIPADTAAPKYFRLRK